MLKFNKQILENQFKNPDWICGVSAEELNLSEYSNDVYHGITKAEIFRTLLEKCAIAVDKEDIFQDKLNTCNIMQKNIWQKTDEFLKKHLKCEIEEKNEAYYTRGEYSGSADFGHTSPNSKLLLEAGFSGLIDRVKKYSCRENLSDRQKDFYKSCEIMLSSIPVYLNRLADATEPYNAKSAECLRNISEKPPENIYEAMQTIISYFFLHEYVAGTRVRTLGRLDVLLQPFYERDIKSGTFTKDEIKEMLKFFLNKFWAAKVPFDLPFCLSGMDKDGNDVTSEISYLIVEAYNEIDINSPKIHIRVCDKTPADFVKLVLRCIRGGNSSFVFVNDNISIKALENVGIEKADAWDYVPIGCYEPAVWGVEIGCTGNGSVNLAKAAELAMDDEVCDFDGFMDSVKNHMACMIDKAAGLVTKIERLYPLFYSDPILSAMYDASIKAGADIFEGSAKYNNSSINLMGIASLTDIVCAVKRLVFDDKRVSFSELSEILKNNWECHEKLRLYAKAIPEKYGNGNKYADSIARELSDFAGNFLNNRPNGRGGVFKAGLFSIDRNFYYGSKTGATADGRFSGEPLSKNLCATVSMDKNGITSLINSVTEMDHSKFPNGSVLDIVLHPSAVSGEDGIAAMYGILLAYFRRGGFAMHGNVFDAEELKNAQNNPEKYANLQVRVCGWNVYFVNLSKEEQDAFIRQAENV